LSGKPAELIGHNGAAAFDVEASDILTSIRPAVTFAKCQTFTVHDGSCMDDVILRLLPEIGEIRDKNLQKKVIACWEEAINFRGWSESLLRSIPFTLLADNVKITFIDHVRAVCRMCLACDYVLEEIHGIRRTPINRDFLVAGALLADVGKLCEFEIVDGKPVKSDFGKHIRHPFSGVALAFKHGIPSEVLHIIATHSKEGEGEKRRPESIIFHHADFIDFELVK
jgi:hypothetical protein